MYHDKGSITVEEKRNTKKYVVAALLLGSVGAVAYFSQKNTTATTNMQYDDAMEDAYEDALEDGFVYSSGGAQHTNIVHEAPYGYRQEVDFTGQPIFDAWGNPVYTEIDWDDQYEWDAWTNTYTNDELAAWAYADQSPTEHTPGYYSNDPYSTNDPNEPFTNAYFYYQNQGTSGANAGYQLDADQNAGASQYDWAFGDPSLRPHTPGFVSNDPYSANDPNEPYSDAYFLYIQQNGGVDPYADRSMMDFAFADTSPQAHTPGFYSNDPYSTNDPSEPFTNAWYQIEQQNAWDNAVNQATDPYAVDPTLNAPPGMMQVTDIWGEPVNDPWGNPIYTEYDPYTFDQWNNDPTARQAGRYSNDWNDPYSPFSNQMYGQQQGPQQGGPGGRQPYSMYSPYSQDYMYHQNNVQSTNNKRTHDNWGW